MIPDRNAKLLDEHATAEKRRLERLAAARQEYERDCAVREQSAPEANAKLDQLARALADGDPHAINDYIGIVLGNSVYPDAFDVEHDYAFDAG